MSGTETDTRSIPRMTRTDVTLQNEHETLDWELGDRDSTSGQLMLGHKQAAETSTNYLLAK